MKRTFNKIISILIIFIMFFGTLLSCKTIVTQKESDCEDNPEGDCSIDVANITDKDKEDINSIENAPLKVYVFSEKGCSYCKKLEDKLSTDFIDENGINKIEIVKYYLDEEGYIIYALEKKMGRKIEGSPVLIVNKDILSGKQEMNKSYINKIKEALKIDPSQRVDLVKSLTAEELAKGKEGAADTVMDSNIFIIIGMGLIDGINPCAFATIIFLISYLAYAKKTKRETLIIGTIYTIAVFVTYFSAGFVFYSVIDAFSGYSIVSLIIKIISIAMVVILAALTLKDFINALRGDFGDMTLTLSDNMKKRIHNVIRDKVKFGGIVISSIIIGIVVSFFELACTGQVYVPTVLLIINEKTMASDVRFIALMKLLVYNIAFIIPLVAIFLISYFGVTSNALQKFLQKNTALIKFLLLLLFVGLSVYMILYYFVFVP